MSINLRLIREAAAAQIAAGIGRRTTGYAYDNTTITLPAVIIRPGAPYVTYHETFGDRCLVGIELEIEVVTSSADDVSAAIAMDDLLSPGLANNSSILEAVEADPTLGGTVGHCWVSEASAPQPDGEGHMSVSLSLHITANKSTF
jgi:hypothetical protein